MNPIPPGAPSRFDLILFVMGVAVLAGLIVPVVSSIPLRVGGGAGSLVAGVAMVDGLVRNPPVEE